MTRIEQREYENGRFYKFKQQNDQKEKLLKIDKSQMNEKLKINSIKFLNEIKIYVT